MSQEQQSQSQHNLDLKFYCESFENLKASSTGKRGTAPYKPLLLLSVIELFSEGLIKENKVFVSDELINTFNKYWKILSPDYAGGLHYPFLHLQNEGFWHLKFTPEFNGLQPKTTKKLKEAIEYAYFDKALFDFLQDPNCRQELIDTLISVWFSASGRPIEDIVKANNSFQDEIQKHNESESSPSFYTRKSAVRNSFFRKAVVQIYDYKCALCELKVTKSLTQNIVEGSHIKPFSVCYDNSINNGISFCKNHHWAFDNGLFCINSEYKIVVINDVFQEEAPNNRSIYDFHGKNLLLPDAIDFFPSPEALQWHRNRWTN